MKQSNELEALAAMLSRFDPDKLTHDVTTLGDAWADANATASALEESRKSQLAALMVEFMDGSGGEGSKKLSAAAAEVRALADPRYTTHVDLMVEARRAAHKARVRYDMGQSRIELMRSQMATLRQEMRFSNM